MEDSLKTDDVLTKAETKIASGYVSGMIGKEIADACNISYNTVVTHTQNIYEKTGIPHSTNALVAWFLSKNFDIDLSEFKRRVGAAFLLAIIAVQMIQTDFDSSFLRSASRRVEASRTKGKRRKEDDNSTCYLY